MDTEVVHVQVETDPRVVLNRLADRIARAYLAALRRLRDAQER